MLKSVAFLAYRDSKGEPVLAGSVFFVGKPVPGENRCERVFAVTALHVIENICRPNHEEDILIRFNLKAGGFTWVTTKLTDWHWIDGALIDVAITERGIPAELDHLVVPFTMCTPVTELENLSYGLGDEANIIGLYVRQPGIEKNMPIVRTGNIASIKPQKIRTRQYGDTIGILVEARSFGGLSGSPVFANLSLFYVKDGNTVSRTGELGKLIGMVHGHHDLGIKKAIQSEKSEPELALDNLNTGIAIVVPIEEIFRTIRSYTKKVNGEEMEIV